MHRETSARARELAAEGLTLDERIERARAKAQRDAQTLHDIVQPSLPSNAEVPLVTLTTDELHDLVYAAVSNVLQRSSPLNKGKSQEAAARGAIEAQQIAYAAGYITRGHDPRPGGVDRE